MFSFKTPKQTSFKSCAKKVSSKLNEYYDCFPKDDINAAKFVFYFKMLFCHQSIINYLFKFEEISVSVALDTCFFLQDFVSLLASENNYLFAECLFKL